MFPVYSTTASGSPGVSPSSPLNDVVLEYTSGVVCFRTTHEEHANCIRPPFLSGHIPTIFGTGAESPVLKSCARAACKSLAGNQATELDAFFFPCVVPISRHRI